ncbi:MAG: hypothetical protein JWO19_5758 [Bryobacterales bacterium]|jgi:hypothetical protein|nr:hypothetical protein [Bryobacterales bacterium]
MVSRRELERLIVLGLGELRQAEVDLENRFRNVPSPRDEGASFVSSLADLKAQAERLEAMLGALENDSHSATPLAA